MPRRTRVWIPSDFQHTLVGSGSNQTDLISTNLDVEMGIPNGGGGQVTIEAIIGSIFYCSANSHNNVEKFGAGINVASEHIDSTDWPSLLTAAARWMWQSVERYTGLSHDSTTTADQRPLHRIPVNVAVMRKVRAEEKLFLYTESFGNSANTEVFIQLRTLIILP